MGSTHLPIVGLNASTTPSLSTLRQINSAGASFQSPSPSRSSKKKSRRVKSIRDDGDGSVSDPAGHNKSIRQGKPHTVSFLFWCQPQTCIDDESFLDAEHADFSVRQLNITSTKMIVKIQINVAATFTYCFNGFAKS
jgi:hypothetical protein